MVPKRILVVTKFFYPRGGACICALNLMELLKSEGHEVAAFSMHYPENLESEWSSYFAKEVSFTGSSPLSGMARVFGGAGLQSNFEKLLTDFKPDVVHLHNIHSYLSPVVARLAFERHIKVVWTLHDFKLICPSYCCLRDGSVCELCFSDKTQVWKKRCMKGTLTASLLAYAEIIYWNRKKLEKWVDTFICPSQFMADTMQRNGFSKDKLKTICNFIPDDFSQEPDTLEGEGDGELTYAFVGRLSREKGVRTLLRVASELPYTLYIAGDGPEKKSLQNEFQGRNIEFLGRLNAGEVKALFRRIRFSVVPSEWYENNPLSVIESLSVGTPVLGSQLGGIPELIEEGETGAIFEARNEKELKEKIIYLFEHRLQKKDLIRRNSLERFSAQNYYRELLKVYNGK